MILLLTFDPWNWHPLQSLHLALVCKTWHSIVTTSGLFWPRISTRHGIRAVQPVLELNRGGKLVVEIDETSEIGSDAEAREAFLALAKPALHRWNTLFYYGNYRESLFRMIGEEGSGIESLFMDVHVGLRTITLGAGRPLRHLALLSASLNWNTNRLNNLRSITLASIRTGPTLAQFYAILSSSQALEILYLEDFWSAEGLGPELVPSPIFLPFLTDIRIGSLPTRLLHFMVDCVRAPSSTSVCIDAITSPSTSVRALELALPSLRSSPLVAIEYSEHDQFAYINTNPNPSPMSSYGGPRVPGADLTIKGISLGYILLRLSEISFDQSVDMIVNLRVLDVDENSPEEIESKEIELRRVHLLHPILQRIVQSEQPAEKGDLKHLLEELEDVIGRKSSFTQDGEHL